LRGSDFRSERSKAGYGHVRTGHVPGLLGSAV
jgi:hypothetical protein